MKKIISAIIVLAMCLSLTGGLTAGAEEATVYTYNFIWNATTNSKMDYKGLPNDLFKNYSSDAWGETERNWKYHGMSAEAYAYWENYKSANDGRGVCGFDAGGVNFVPQKNQDWFTLQLRVPEAGLYKLSYIAPVQESSVLNKNMHVGVLPTSWTESSIRGLQNGVQTSLFFLASGIDLNSTFSASANSLSYVNIGTSVIPINTDGGEVVVSFSTADAKDTLKNKIRFRGLRLEKVSDELVLNYDEVILDEGGAAETVTASLKNYVAVRSMPGVAYEIANTDIATVTTSGVITPVSEGKTTLTAKIGDVTKTINVTVNGKAPEEDQALVGAFDATIDENVSYTAPMVTGVTMDNDVITSTPGTVAGSFNLTADAEKNGKKFLYWAKGKTLGKKIISFSNELTNYMPEANDKNHILIAIYEDDVPEKEEWYNANGQRIATETAPEEYPSMAGYGTAEGWDDYTDKIHVARYARQTPTAGIDVTVVDGNGGGTNLTYGDTVTCTADEAAYGTFKCWTKTDINGNTEIVSVDEIYKFRAWETCTVTALYDEDYTYNGNTMKIILDAFDVGNEKAVMAEFIGFGSSAVEKGIIWNGAKIAMTKPGTQFTLTGNVGDAFEGYAIIKNDDESYSEVTDGNVTLK